jgi:hypothetical protein
MSNEHAYLWPTHSSVQTQLGCLLRLASTQTPLWRQCEWQTFAMGLETGISHCRPTQVSGHLKISKDNKHMVMRPFWEKIRTWVTYLHTAAFFKTTQVPPLWQSSGGHLAFFGAVLHSEGTPSLGHWQLQSPGRHLAHSHMFVSQLAPL